MRPRSSNNGESFRAVTGVTLIELMVVIAIVAILTTLATPTFSRLIADSAIKQQTESLMDDLRYARSTALKRGRSVTLCASENPTAASPTCKSSDPDWSKGWIIFIDEDAPLNNTFESTDELLRRQEALGRSGGIRTGTGGASGQPPVFLRFNSDGRTTGLQGSFVFQPAAADLTLERSICIATTGRPRITAVGTTTC